MSKEPPLQPLRTDPTNLNSLFSFHLVPGTRCKLNKTFSKSSGTPRLRYSSISYCQRREAGQHSLPGLDFCALVLIVVIFVLIFVRIWKRYSVCFQYRPCLLKVILNIYHTPFTKSCVLSVGAGRSGKFRTCDRF